MFSLLVKKKENFEFLTFGLNVNGGCYPINVLFTKLILIKIKQYEHE